MIVTFLSIDERKAVCRDFGRTVETVSVVCMECGKQSNDSYSHGATDAQIAKACFPKWRVKGVGGRRKTLCPACQDH